MRDHEGGRHYLEAEDPMRGGLLHPRTGESTQALALQICCDATQHLGQVRAGTAAGVENVHVLAGQPVGDAEVVLEGLVHAGHHVAHHLGGGVPHAKLLAQVGVEGLEERFVEVGHGLALAEFGKEGVAFHAVERGGRPVQHFHQAQGLQPARVRNLLEQCP